MSIDIKDHRRYAEGRLADSVATAKAHVEAPLVAQAPSELAETGDEKLDKMLRAIQEMVNLNMDLQKQVALAGMDCGQTEALHMRQLEYFFVKGKLHAYAEVAQLPARIVAESKLHLV